MKYIIDPNFLSNFYLLLLVYPQDQICFRKLLSWGFFPQPSSKGSVSRAEFLSCQDLMNAPDSSECSLYSWHQIRWLLRYSEAKVGFPAWSFSAPFHIQSQCQPLSTRSSRRGCGCIRIDDEDPFLRLTADTSWVLGQRESRQAKVSPVLCPHPNLHGI